MRNAQFYFYAAPDNKIALVHVQNSLAPHSYGSTILWLEVPTEQWSLTASKKVTGLTEIYQLEKTLRMLAHTYSCEYDGHSIEL